jgi:hypothetical protein
MTSAPTLRDLYSPQLERIRADPTTPQVTDLGEDRGWLLSAGVPDVVQPFVTRTPLDDADLATYAGLDAAAAAVLLSRLTDDQLADRQNDAPTLGTLLRAAAEHPDDVEVHGYLVGPARRDERLTAEGIDVYGVPDLDITPGHHAGCECDALFALVQELGVTFAEWPPDSMVTRVNPWRPNETCWHLWWD